jgi:hypothetical protein
VTPRKPLSNSRNATLIRRSRSTHPLPHSVPCNLVHCDGAERPGCARNLVAQQQLRFLRALQPLLPSTLPRLWRQARAIRASAGLRDKCRRQLRTVRLHIVALCDRIRGAGRRLHPQLDSGVRGHRLRAPRGRPLGGLRHRGPAPCPLRVRADGGVGWGWRYGVVGEKDGGWGGIGVKMFWLHLFKTSPLISHPCSAGTPHT